MMVSKNDLENAKKAFDFAWAQAEKYADEAMEALRMAEQVQARDTSDMFVEKAKRAMVAHDNWLKSTRLATKVMDEYYNPVRKTMG